MTKLSYKINYDGVTLVEETSYEKACAEFTEAKENAPMPWKVELETVLTPFDPYDTEERRAQAKAHREKVWAKRKGA